MLKVVIVDDEAAARDLLCADLRTYCPQLNVVGVAATFAEGHRLLTDLQPDIVFMDVDLHDVDGDGIALLELHPHAEFVVIFFTGHDQYVEDSYRLDAVYYVKKPLSVAHLKHAVDKASLRVQSLRRPAAFYRLATLKGYEFIPWEEIVWLEADGEATRLYLENGEKKTSTESLGEVQRKLSVDDFHRVHRSHVVNRAFVRGYQREGYVVLEDGRQVPVSTANREGFLQWFERPVGRG
jgi:two-component system, LytTR family, response regulator